MDCNISISILHFCELADNALDFCKNCLTVRQQAVMYCRESSNIPSRRFNPEFHSPHGSFLSPLLFPIYTSNFISYLKNITLHFCVDGTQLYFFLLKWNSSSLSKNQSKLGKSEISVFHCVTEIFNKHLEICTQMKNFG